MPAQKMHSANRRAGAWGRTAGTVAPVQCRACLLLLLVCLSSATRLRESWEVENQEALLKQAAKARERGKAGRSTQSVMPSAVAASNTTTGSGAWDGVASWEVEHPRTLYFEPIAGLGNRLRALASAVVLAREHGVGLKVIWREQLDCGPDCGNSPPFNSTWQDLFSAPNMRLAENFPGSNFSVHEEDWYLGADSLVSTAHPPANCTVHIVRNYTHFQDILTNKWAWVQGEEIVCAKSDLWLTKNGYSDGSFFFPLLKPATPVQALIDNFKAEMKWDIHQWVCIHIRRTDLHIVGENNQHHQIDSLISLSKYIDSLRKLQALAAGVKGQKAFLATDDIEAEMVIKRAFPEGMVNTYPKTAWSRSSVEGIQQAMVDVMLLSSCPVLIGTYYSSYSETAKLIGRPFYIQVGHELKDIATETLFEEEEEGGQAKLKA